MPSAPDGPGDAGLPRFRDLDASTRQQALIVVLHDAHPVDDGHRWALSLADIAGRPLAREHLRLPPDEDPTDHLGVDLHLGTVGMRVHGEWFTGTDPDRPRRYARVVPDTPGRD